MGWGDAAESWLQPRTARLLAALCIGFPLEVSFEQRLPDGKLAAPEGLYGSSRGNTAASSQTIFQSMPLQCGVWK